MEIGNPIRPDELIAVTGETIKTKIVIIPPWNMDTTGTVSVPHGLNVALIMAIFGWVRNDVGDEWHPMTPAYNGDGESLVCFYMDDTHIWIERKAAGYFDQAAYSSILFDRGRIHIFFQDV